MTDTHATGEYITAWCTKCKLELGHTIVAMVENVPKRVKCNTCNGEHNYRTGPATSNRIKSIHAKRKTKARETKYHEYMMRLSDDRLSNVKKYMTKGNFEKDDVVEHPKFGTGIVVSVIHFNKIEVFFKDGPKLLAQNL
ncbi:MAG: hypothetical protein AMK71_01030 [Nitrospira bacterium SG8_35_4]|nr:MAG: hypothetical protein AMK71_01030 [Nitrospira bacterium SG8_35_4]